MKYIDEYRDPERVARLSEAIRENTKHSWNIMEICGGQTHSIAQYRLEEMLPEKIHLLHGPGCPVCVTPIEIIDRAIAIAKMDNVIFCSFGDMMRVPGSHEDLLQVKARGAEVRMLYSPLDALEIARQNPEKEVVFFAIGFETTAPIHLMALSEAIREDLSNFSLLTSLFCVPPAIEALLSDPICHIDGFLAAGHVCTITGNEDYRNLAKKFKTPMVVTGFEPADLLYGILCCVEQLEKGSYEMQNAYKRVVSDEGNIPAKRLMKEMLEPVDQEWRGIGHIPKSGLKLNDKYSAWDAAKRFNPTYETLNLSSSCIAGEIMRGLRQSADCPHFGKECNPDHPIGAPMVSAEGVCAAYFKYK